ESGDGPGGGQSEDHGQRDRDRRGQKGEPDRRQGVRLAQRGEVDGGDLGKRLREDRDEGDEEEQAQEEKCCPDEQAADERRFRGRGRTPGDRRTRMRRHGAHRTSPQRTLHPCVRAVARTTPLETTRLQNANAAAPTAATSANCDTRRTEYD